MSISSKSPKKILRVALKVGAKALPDYAHRFSPQRYTQAQLYACLVLKMFFRTDYRGIEAILNDSPQLCTELGIARVPHFTTLQKAERRLLKSASAARLLEESIFFGAQ